MRLIVSKYSINLESSEIKILLILASKCKPKDVTVEEVQELCIDGLMPPMEIGEGR